MWFRILTSGWTYVAVLSVLLLVSEYRREALKNETLTRLVEESKLWNERLEYVLAREREVVAELNSKIEILEKERIRIENEKDNVIADLRAGNLRLRQRFQCPANTTVSPASPATSVGDGGTGGGLLDSDAEFLVRLAAEADNRVVQLQACQAVLKELTQ